MKRGVLKPGEDAFGREVLGFLRGKNSCEITERDDGYISARYSPSVYFSEYADWPTIEKQAMEFVRGRVLDIGCGVGRHSIYLQNKGFDVTGIDISPLAAKIAKQRGLKKVKLMSLTDLHFNPNSFDTVIMMGGNFGLIGTPERGKTILRKLNRITSEDGIILAETRDPYRTEDPLHLEYHKQNLKKGKLGGQMKIRIRFEKTVSRWFKWLLVSKNEIQQIVKATGWKVDRFLDSEGSSFVAVLRKRESSIEKG